MAAEDDTTETAEALIERTVAAALANPNGLGVTPPMGWRSWNFMKQDVSQPKILEQVAALVESRSGRQSSTRLGKVARRRTQSCNGLWIARR